MESSTQDLEKIIKRAWDEAEFKARLLSDPEEALKEEGIEVPEGVTVTVVENTKSAVHLVIPMRPEQELSDEQLEKVSGGSFWGDVGRVLGAAAADA